MNIALILSGGTGTRLGNDIPKQYLECNGKKIVTYCMETFQKCELVDVIWVVAHQEFYELFEKEAIPKLKGFSKPGETRQVSIYNGLKDLSRFVSDEDVVIIHDAARPLVSEKMICELIEKNKECDGVIPVLPMKDTVYFSEDGKKISKLVEREKIYAGQAPESFLYGKYLAANEKLLPEKIYRINGTTEPAIMAEMNIAMIQGDESNFKITTKQDLERFEEMLKQKA